MKPGIAIFTLLLTAALSLVAKAEGVNAVVPVHPLEQQALSDPSAVLKALPAAIAASQRNKDSNELALLYMAQANACRVLANWRCQRSAAHAASMYAAQIDNTALQVKGKIQEARAVSALGDYNLSSNLLTEADQLLQKQPNDFLAAEIFLAYSSVSNQLGRSRNSAEFSSKGIALLEGDSWQQRSDDDPLRVRLLRNLGRAQGQLGDHVAAVITLQRGGELVKNINDPKLHAELMIELNRVAAQSKNLPLMKQTADQILQHAGNIKNTQLTGMGHEAQAGYALALNNADQARKHYSNARASFRQLNLQRDELRVLKSMLPLYRGRAESEQLAIDALELSNIIAVEDRKETSDDFDQRVAYMQDVSKLEKARAAAELTAAKNQTTRQQLYTSLALTALAIMAAILLGLRYRWQRHRNELAQKAQSRRHQMMLGTSHDIRNALMVINGAVDLLLLRNLAGDALARLKQVRAAGENLQGLAQDLLDSERLELGKINLQLRPTKLEEFLSNLIEIHQLRVNKPDVRMRLEWDKQLPELWMIDPLRLHQILSNLLSNALKFTDQGSVDLVVSRADITVDATNKFIALFSVRDTGCGISKDEQQSLFKPFQKGESGERYAEGAGLGLSIAHDLVNLMGGKLQVLSELNKGSTFYFTLNSAQPNEEELRATPDINLQSKDSSQLRVLLVEDEPINRELVGIYLERSGCIVRAVDSMNKAMIELSIAKFDVLISDYELADGTGVDLTQKMRGLYSGSRHSCASIILSGHEPSEERGEKLVDIWLTKPATIESIGNAIESLSIR